MIDLRPIAVYAANAIKRRIRQGKVKPPSRKEKGTTLVDSGRLMRSINYRIDGNTVIIGTNVKYARIHHEGGIITPKKAKALAIPLTPAAKAQSPRDFSNTFIRNGIIFKKNDDNSLTALYKLEKSVSIPARPYMYLEPEEIEHINKTLIKNVREYLKV